MVIKTIILGGMAALLALFAVSVLQSEEVPEAPAMAAAPIVSEPLTKNYAQRRIDYRRLDARIQRLMQEENLVGLAVGIVENGEVSFLKGYGKRGADSDAPVTTDTVFRWASLSKGVAGTLASKLDARGAIGLDQSIANYSRSLQLPGGAQVRARVRDVLSHRLGLWRNAYDDRLEGGQDPAIIRRALSGTQLTCEPGTCWSYQNVAFDAFSDVVEKATGKTYAATVKEELFGPLGMNSASLTRDGLVGAQNWARPHSAGGRVLDVDNDYYRVPTAGGVNSDIGDLVTWMQAQMGRYPDVIAPSVNDEAQRALVDTPTERRRLREFRERLSEPRYGLGWRIYDYAGHRLVGHRGGVDGYRAFILFDPAAQTGIVALWNSNHGKPHGLQFEAMDLYYGLEFRDWLRLDEG
ncbi:serine hydrolase domain-containing protein [Sphingomicrobium marinum]|uniref:serine hydrolase domain-containing protein n=1 Tax=Sphingomicrobium marinum TaxID=1227950 RepID=UPI00223F57DA|nr:serine hydrolase domain-containing protein [Sphingomicrobium marinum]